MDQTIWTWFEQSQGQIISRGDGCLEIRVGKPVEVCQGLHSTRVSVDRVLVEMEGWGLDAAAQEAIRFLYAMQTRPDQPVPPTSEPLTPCYGWPDASGMTQPGMTRPRPIARGLSMPHVGPAEAQPKSNPAPPPDSVPEATGAIGRHIDKGALLPVIRALGGEAEHLQMFAGKLMAWMVDKITALTDEREALRTEIKGLKAGVGDAVQAAADLEMEIALVRDRGNRLQEWNAGTRNKLVNWYRSVIEPTGEALTNLDLPALTDLVLSEFRGRLLAMEQRARYAESALEAETQDVKQDAELD